MSSLLTTKLTGQAESRRSECLHMLLTDQLRTHGGSLTSALATLCSQCGVLHTTEDLLLLLQDKRLLPYKTAVYKSAIVAVLGYGVQEYSRSTSTQSTWLGRPAEAVVQHRETVYHWSRCIAGPTTPTVRNRMSCAVGLGVRASLSTAMNLTQINASQARAETTPVGLTEH